MITLPIQFSLVYEGLDADNHAIDLYDVSRALMGFQRTLALTTHLVLNGEIITQSPSLKGARIYTLPPEPGSWKTVAVIIGGVGTGLYSLGTAPKDTPLGHIVRSAYDYVIKESLGFHVDYEKTLLEKYEENKKKIPNIPQPTESKMDSLIEKCEAALKDIHRPIIESNTARQARIFSLSTSGNVQIGESFTKGTYEYVSITESEDDRLKISGKISSYNSNTYKGRIYVGNQQRPVPFLLSDEARTRRIITKITRSLSINATDRMNEAAEIELYAYRYLSVTGRLKSLLILGDA